MIADGRCMNATKRRVHPAAMWKRAEIERGLAQAQGRDGLIPTDSIIVKHGARRAHPMQWQLFSLSWSLILSQGRGSD